MIRSILRNILLVSLGHWSMRVLGLGMLLMRWTGILGLGGVRDWRMCVSDFYYLYSLYMHMFVIVLL